MHGQSMTGPWMAHGAYIGSMDGPWWVHGQSHEHCKDNPYASTVVPMDGPR